MSLSREEVMHIAQLARIGVTDEDVTKFQDQLSQILDHFQALQELDTGSVPPTSHPLPLENVMRADDPHASLPRDQVLANAPQVDDDSFKVRPVLE